MPDIFIKVMRDHKELILSVFSGIGIAILGVIAKLWPKKIVLSLTQENNELSILNCGNLAIELNSVAFNFDFDTWHLRNPATSTVSGYRKETYHYKFSWGAISLMASP